ncbi:hypothetical protein J1N35_028270 [Gossypium stocksii]|uniref:Uncharacterized protein n=1 Tax=Gossypium stocksii TaxID=47602 RepID=A0A9D3UVX0_9ROSI|nr:hypothetical protein J1N35_028270 [Gossypium stocksii]
MELENEEIEIKVPQGLVLLFPSQNAIGVDELKSMHFEVKNLIVLDGLGENVDGLENLLDVFESMVGDQRRLKDERLSKITND